MCVQVLIVVGVLKRMTFLGGGRACIGFKFSLMEMSAYLSPSSQPRSHSCRPPAEVVLYILLQSFEFARADKDIKWILSVIANPVVPSSGSSKPQMPLRVSLLNKPAEPEA